MRLTEAAEQQKQIADQVSIGIVFEGGPHVSVRSAAAWLIAGRDLSAGIRFEPWLQVEIGQGLGSGAVNSTSTPRSASKGRRSFKPGANSLGAFRS